MPQCYRFGEVEIRPTERRILVGGQPAPVGARAFDLLLALIERRDRVVTKDELLELVWPGVVVEENNLQVQVSALRKLLGPQALATIPGRGYRLAIELDHDTGSPPAPRKRNHNLPAPLNSFVGRERELEEIARLLGTARLVTLTGTGGAGKTRLSLQVAAIALVDYPDGVWFVELAPLADERLVAQAVATVLGVKEAAGRTLPEALERHVADRRLLLVLDNCEHLARACAELAKRLLQAGGALRILASSRERLRVAGEAAYPVPSLAIPDRLDAANGDAPPPLDLERLARTEAVRLFIDRARGAQHAFNVDRRNAAAVADICRRLDGIPLAIELAAARVDSLSVDQIASRLDERFGLLTEGDPTAMPHHQALRASIDWSYDLLSASERALLQRLSVFAGGWTLEAAGAVGDGGDTGETGAVDLLVPLVEKSLVVMDAGGERYRLLETVRQYAQERLHDSGDEVDARARHLGYYLALAEKARPELAGPAQGAWLARLDLERENLLAAHGWADRAPEGAAAGLRLAWALKPYWINRGFPDLGLRMTVEALCRPGAEARTHDRCRGLFDAGQIGTYMGRYAEAQAHLEESLAIAREIGDKRVIAAALQPLGLACLGQGDTAAARTHLHEALVMARELGNPREIAAALNVLAQLLRTEGELDAAEPLYEQGLALARELQDRESIAIGLLNLAMVSIDRASRDRARPMLLEAAAIADEIGSKRTGQCVLEVSAGLAASRKDWESAARFYGAAEATAGQTGLQRDPADEAFLAPRIAAARKALAAPKFAAAESAGRALTYPEALGELRAWLESRA